MKRAPMLLAATILTATGCDRLMVRTPEAVAQAWVDRANAGNVDGFIGLHTPKSQAAMQATEKTSGMTVADSLRRLTKNGTLDTMRVANMAMNETLGTATLELSYRFRDGTGGGGTLKLERQSDGSWRIVYP